MRVLFDTDLVLDLVLDREPFVDAAAAVFTLHENGRIRGYISGITMVNVFYLTRKSKGISGARKAVEELLSTLSICPLDQLVLENAHRLTFTDYEDAVQHACATASGLDAIVTRNLADYKNATLPVFSPADFLSQLTPPE
ncbi:MAG TPA: PIN domain-containing protein [Pyrinomonadaceae bacterium]|jgi:predicted nucleic acid-binding protein|nr:PIN domain-containing protein [Pyrinomonadaceae bacterium]